jgi:hypothetical protein
MIGIFSCNKKFDTPPPFEGYNVMPNLSIKELRKMHFSGNFEQILDAFIIKGIVIANDSSDNFYKTIVLQDSTGGITVRLDGSSIFNQYPIGSVMGIQLKGLWLGDYARMIQLGAGVDRTDPQYPELIPIPQPLFDRFIKRSPFIQNIIPRLVKLEELNDSLQSCLIKIDHIEFAASDTGRTYADVINKQSINRLLKVCGNGSIYLHNSGFASFAGVKTPRGNGSITAVYSVFNTEKQLMIRDTSDIQMDGIRCTGLGAKVLLDEDFESLKNVGDLSLNGWRNIDEIGGKPFQSKISSNNHYAEISAFASNVASIQTWLISPAINLSNSANEILSFQTKDGYDNGGVLQAYVSTNYDGSPNPSKAKWVLLKSNISKGSVNTINSNWVSSGNISLTGYNGNIFIAFRYDGADPAITIDKRTTTFQIDNIRILGN